MIEFPTNTGQTRAVEDGDTLQNLGSRRCYTVQVATAEKVIIQKQGLPPVTLTRPHGWRIIERLSLPQAEAAR